MTDIFFQVCDYEIFNDENDNDIMTIEISPLFLIIAIIPCRFSIICIISFSIYSSIRVLINKK